jgi:hypothetical protein
MTYKRALVMCAHTDDMEFGCGGTIARLIEQDTQPFVLVFSMVNPGINPPGILKEEFYLSHIPLAHEESLSTSSGNSRGNRCTTEAN